MVFRLSGSVLAGLIFVVPAPVLSQVPECAEAVRKFTLKIDKSDTVIRSCSKAIRVHEQLINEFPEMATDKFWQGAACSSTDNVSYAWPGPRDGLAMSIMVICYDAMILRFSRKSR